MFRDSLLIILNNMYCKPLYLLLKGFKEIYNTFFLPQVICFKQIVTTIFTEKLVKKANMSVLQHVNIPSWH